MKLEYFTIIDNCTIQPYSAEGKMPFSVFVRSCEFHIDDDFKIWIEVYNEFYNKFISLCDGIISKEALFNVEIFSDLTKACIRVRSCLNMSITQEEDADYIIDFFSICDGVVGDYGIAVYYEIEKR